MKNSQKSSKHLKGAFCARNTLQKFIRCSVLGQMGALAFEPPLLLSKNSKYSLDLPLKIRIERDIFESPPPKFGQY